MEAKIVKLDRGFVVKTKMGHIFDPKAGTLSAIDMNDVSHALSNLCRYSGHCRKFYSVAEHSILVGKIVADLWPEDRAAVRAAFLHDATEAYVTDLPTPIKVLLPDYIALEDKLAADLAEAFHIQWSPEIAERVKFADMAALATEARLLFDDVSEWDAIKSYESRNDLLLPGFPLAPGEAKKQFMRAFIELEKERLYENESS